jgi:hypothetical protein
MMARRFDEPKRIPEVWIRTRVGDYGPVLRPGGHLREVDA